MQEHLKGVIDHVATITRASSYSKKFEYLN